jgi:hypothetical protein
MTAPFDIPLSPFVLSREWQKQLRLPFHSLFGITLYRLASPAIFAVPSGISVLFSKAA